MDGKPETDGTMLGRGFLKVAVIALGFIAGCISGPPLVGAACITMIADNPRNAFACVGDFVRYVFTTGGGAERVRSTAFVPAAFDVSDTQTVHRLSFTPKYPQTHNVVVRYPWTDDGWGKPDDSHGASVRLGGDGKFYRHYPVSAALTVRHRGSPAMELPVREAKLWCAYSGGGHELMLGRLDMTRFSWWYGDPIEIEVRLLKPIEGIPFVRGTNGTLVVYSQMPFE